MSKYEFYEIFVDADSGGMAKDPELNFDSVCNRYLQFTGKPVPDWQTLHCSIIKIKGEGFQDYQMDIHGFRLCSQRMKDLFEANKSPEDKIQWLDVTATWNGETRPYYILHFYEDTDVLDPVLSKWNPKTKTYDAIPVIYIREKIGNHNVFACPQDTLGLTVRAFILKEMKRLKMTGMTWEPATVVAAPDCPAAKLEENNDDFNEKPTENGETEK